MSVTSGSLDRYSSNSSWMKFACRSTLRQAGSTQRPFSIILADLDQFKSINDRFGHSVGDEVLRQTAERLRDGIRETDQLALIDGDEFTAIVSAGSEPPTDLALEIGRRPAAELLCVVQDLSDGLPSPFRVSPALALHEDGQPTWRDQ
ncbi:GGDEF domain-containing protein [Aureimonas jatrophae]|uniref:Diguanylate cyclase (GGDEF) domain-containing protein n=1 Tax=Aureimonas jatrophae TaxID=1166073 RepID=A0A1H0MK46_9HYPH|nr:GGDEF domain-containing protein [Aureimonas jatrophae]MBB3952916.1 diguanylate cyclase (GGDEF)-like protein [Aureimonas jatrophae]SDO80819.1 diguanylate cyclase (GGDEF) domain-containing protein [Aureimonas jatrophae]